MHKKVKSKYIYIDPQKKVFSDPVIERIQRTPDSIDIRHHSNAVGGARVRRRKLHAQKSEIEDSSSSS